MLGVEIHAEHSWHFATTKLLLKLSKWTNKNFNITSILTDFCILAEPNLDWRCGTVFFFSTENILPYWPSKDEQEKRSTFKSQIIFLIINMETQILFHPKATRIFRVRVIAYDVGNRDSGCCWKARVGTWIWVSYIPTKLSA